MEAKSLRIGNWIERLFEGESVGVEQCTVRTIWDIFKAETEESKFQFKPIPLTEEWLLKFGFKQGDNETFNDSFFTIKIGICMLAINPNNGVVWIHRRASTFFNNPALVPHVHALQNLYFALTGEELEIKKVN